ncbi:hypothetical protein ASPCADRAFT_210816 [Aspergillus carbonarius ITEM 5010]|uniref:Uncharacterized protein n=1 Tax=Aspergillus carbonarius (strain ITEM 5010) TaxID=602072 RepID=A0A1R3RBN4_ASPC5|nr:hypothetical protein ASPCADRAFT_210816 [Aspergillus carbonarius ITEM 5010]
MAWGRGSAEQPLVHLVVVPRIYNAPRHPRGSNQERAPPHARPSPGLWVAFPTAGGSLTSILTHCASSNPIFCHI